MFCINQYCMIAVLRYRIIEYMVLVGGFYLFDQIRLINLSAFINMQSTLLNHVIPQTNTTALSLQSFTHNSNTNEKSRPQLLHHTNQLDCKSPSTCISSSDVRNLNGELYSLEMDRNNQWTNKNNYCLTCQQTIVEDSFQKVGYINIEHQSHQIGWLDPDKRQNLNIFLQNASTVNQKMQILVDKINHLKQQAEILALDKQRKLSLVQTRFTMIKQQIQFKYRSLSFNQHQLQQVNQNIAHANAQYYSILQYMNSLPHNILLTQSEHIKQSYAQLQNRTASIQINDISSVDKHGEMYRYDEEFIYKVNQFSSMKEAKKELVSEQFSACNSQWIIKVYPSGFIGPNSPPVMKSIEYLSVYVEMKGSRCEGHKFRIKISLISNNKQAISKQYKAVYVIGESWGYDRYIRISNLSKKNLISYDNSIAIKVQIAFANNYEGCVAASQIIASQTEKIAANEERIRQLREKLNPKSDVEQVGIQNKETKGSNELLRSCENKKKWIKYPQISLEKPLNSKIIRLYSAKNSQLIKNRKLVNKTSL